MPKEGVVCQACRKDVTRALSDSSFVPGGPKPVRQENVASKNARILSLPHCIKQKLTILMKFYIVEFRKSYLCHMQAALPCSVQQTPSNPNSLYHMSCITVTLSP